MPRNKKCDSKVDFKVKARRTKKDIRIPPYSHTSTLAPRSTFFSRVYTLVRKIPRGKVTTYGQIARAIGAPGAARTVGWAMRVCPDRVPWHRVINARGEISLRPTTGYHEQRARLKAEGIRFNRAGKIDLKKYGWKYL